jgi:hypothetical protein
MDGGGLRMNVFEWAGAGRRGPALLPGWVFGRRGRCASSSGWCLEPALEAGGRAVNGPEVTSAACSGQRACAGTTPAGAPRLSVMNLPAFPLSMFTSLSRTVPGRGRNKLR